MWLDENLLFYEEIIRNVLKNFAKLTEKRLCQNLFFNIIAGGLQLY